MASLFSDFLTALGVKHTTDYSDARFAAMPFQSMFGLSELLKEYAVGSVCVTVEPDARQLALATFDTPFLIDTPSGFAIVESVASNKVTYTSQDKTFTATIDELANGWNGIALLACTDVDSAEPSYERHHVAEIAKGVKQWVLIVLAIGLLGFAMWRANLYSQAAAWAIVILDCAGIFFSWLLVQKSLGIHNKAAEAVCSMLERGGCDELARSEASSFMGIFKWSEVGLSYFSVSLAAMLLFPDALPTLAAINILCLPYTVWSITYQKFKAKVWCTLCVCVQATLWALFAAYLIGGWTHDIIPLKPTFWIEFVVLGACYLTTLLGLNRLNTVLLKYFNVKD